MAADIIPLFERPAPQRPPLEQIHAAPLLRLVASDAAHSATNVTARRFVDVHELAQRLCIDDLAPRTIIERLRDLYRHMHLPAPRNPRFVGGLPVTGARAICAASRWDRGEILVWLDGGATPDSTAIAPPPAAAPALRQRMADRARQLTARRA